MPKKGPEARKSGAQLAAFTSTFTRLEKSVERTRETTSPWPVDVVDEETRPTRRADQSHTVRQAVNWRLKEVTRQTSPRDTKYLQNKFCVLVHNRIHFSTRKAEYPVPKHSTLTKNDDARQPPLYPSSSYKTPSPYHRFIRPTPSLVHDYQMQFNTFWGNDNDGIAADAKLGYQVPRLWFPHAKPGQAGVHTEERAPASAGVSMPEPRSRASGGADLPIGTDAVVQEYQQMQAFRAYRLGHELRSRWRRMLDPCDCTDSYIGNLSFPLTVMVVIWAKTG